MHCPGDHVISGSDDTCLCMTDIVEGKTVLTHRTGHFGNIFQAKYVPTQENEMITAARDGMVRHYQVSSGDRVTERELARHAGATHKLSVYNRNEVLSAGEDGIVIQTDLRTNKNSTIVEQDKPLYSIDTDYNDYIVLSGVSAETWLYDLRNPTRPALVYNPFSQEEDSDDDEEEEENDDFTGTCCKFNHNGTALIVSYNNDTIYLYNTHDNTEYRRKYRGHRNHDTVKGVNFYGLNSEYVMSGSDCGHIFLWDTATENIVQCLVGEDDGIVNVLEYNPYSPMIASSGLEHCVKIWTPNLEEETELSDLNEIIEKNASRDSLSQDVLTIFLSRMNGEELQNSCRQS